MTPPANSPAEEQPAPHPDGEHHLRERLADAALRAEMMTGASEVSVEEARESLHRRMVRGGVGVVLVALGLALLPLPGPGWLIVIAGLTQLPFAWAERTVTLIRRRIPGVPESGAIPTHTWIIMGTLVVLSTALGLVFGDELSGWVKGKF